MRSYIYDSKDLIAFFEQCNFSLIPILENCIVYSLATSTAVFTVPIHPSGNCEVKVRNRPSIFDNVKCWQVFEDDKQIQKFLTLTGEFDGLIVDE